MAESTNPEQSKNISKNAGYKNFMEEAKKLRQDTFNTFVGHVEAHIGGAFSMTEILIALYGKFLKEEDKFILTKGYVSIPVYLLLQEKY